MAGSEHGVALLDERIARAQRHRERVRNTVLVVLLLIIALAIVEALLSRGISAIAFVVPVLLTGGILETVAAQRQADLVAIRDALRDLDASPA